jgi:SulP family sulfate permease
LLMVLGYTAIDFGRVRLVWRVGRAERWTMIVTAALTLFMSPPLAILAGVFLSMISFVQASATTDMLIRLARGADGRYAEAAMPTAFPSGDTTVLRLQGYLVFAGIETIEQRLAPMLATRNAALVLSVRGYTTLGSTGLAFLERFARAMHGNGNRFVLADVAAEIRAELERTGVLDVLGAANVVAAQPLPDASLDDAYGVATRATR